MTRNLILLLIIAISYTNLIAQTQDRDNAVMETTIIKNESSVGHQINLKDLPAGPYLLRLSLYGRQVIKRFIKQ